jgi:hypothetical protein
VKQQRPSNCPAAPDGDSAATTWSTAALGFAPVLAGLMAVALACTLCRDHNVVMLIRVPAQFLFLVTIALSMAAALGPKVWRGAVTRGWVLLSLTLLVIRLVFPGGVSLDTPWGDVWLPDAYGGSTGTWAWIALHAVGCTTAARLRGRWLSVLGVLCLLCWSVAIVLFLLNSPYSGDDLWSRWR